MHSPTAIRLTVLILAVSAVAPAASGRDQDGSPKPLPTALSVGGDVPHPIAWTLADLKAMPRTTVTVPSDARPIVYEGVLVGELLGRAGAPLGRDLMGKALATYVTATAADGYAVVFSLGELDPAMSASEIIVADTMDGKPLPDGQGPLRIATPHDKRGSRAMHMLVRLDVVRLAKSPGRAVRHARAWPVVWPAAPPPARTRS